MLDYNCCRTLPINFSIDLQVQEWPGISRRTEPNEESDRVFPVERRKTDCNIIVAIVHI